MTNRERILSIVHRREVDRVPFVMYDGLLPLNEVDEILGRDRLGLMRWSGVHKVTSPNCRIESDEYEAHGQRRRKNTLHTPKGSIFEERAFEPAYGSSSIRKHYVEDAEDFDVLWAFLEDSVVEADYDRFHQDAAELGERGVPLVAVERTPYQQLWVQWTGLDNLGYHLADYPERVEKTIQLLIRRSEEIFAIVRESPAEFIDFPDNITAPTIGPDRFRRYCVPLYNRLADMLSSSGRPVFVHMDGDLKPLWEEIGASGVAGLDSFSPAPDNDTTLEDALRLWPEMRIFMNFPSSVHLKSREEIQMETGRMLDSAASSNRFQIQLSENVPYTVWPVSLPAIADTIDEYYS